MQRKILAMAVSVNINGTAFISSKEAAKQAGYSADYIAKLAREQKIVGTIVNRAWFVDPASLQNFLETMRIEKEARRALLQRQRADESVIRAERAVHASNAVSAASEGRVGAAVFAGVLVLVGLVSVTSLLKLYASFVAEQPHVAYVSLTQTYTPPQAELQLVQNTVEPTVVSPNFMEPTIPTEGFSEGVLLFSSSSVASSSLNVEQLFSDPVSVKFIDHRTGAVVFEQEDGDEISYPLVIIPTAGN